MNSKNSLTLPSSTTVSLDGFSNLVANKMAILIERGSPQDFLDIYTLCYEGLITASQCWQLWKAQQRSTGHAEKTIWAKLAILTHINEMGQPHSPEKIADPIESSIMPHIQMWFQTDFLEAL